MPVYFMAKNKEKINYIRYETMPCLFTQHSPHNGF